MESLMLESSIDRFLERNRIQENLNNKPGLQLVPREEDVNALLQSEINCPIYEKLDNGASATRLLEDLRNEFKNQNPQHLLLECRDAVLDAIIRPFGLAHILYNDKDGGTVTTIHNARQSVYASEADRYNRKHYNYCRKSAIKRTQNTNGTIQSTYTGKVLEIFQVDVDHVVPLKKLHNDGCFMLSVSQKKELARDCRNLAIVEANINRSKGAQELESFMNNSSGNRVQLNGNYFGMDKARTTEKLVQADKAVREHLPDTGAKVQYYTNRAAVTGTHEGLHMGLQQAIGLLLVELVNGIFDETKDILKTGLKDNHLGKPFFNEINCRFSNVKNRVFMRWHDVIIAFGQGFITGFFSNLTTVIINMFFTTAKRVVRMIREGTYSLFQALKTVICSQKGISRQEALHDASKILIAGITITVGIAAEEYVEKMVLATGILAPFAEPIAAVITGLVVGLTTVLAVYMIDKVDFFGVNEEKQHRFIVKKLDEMIQQAVANAEELVSISNFSCYIQNIS